MAHVRPIRRDFDIIEMHNFSSALFFYSPGRCGDFASPSLRKHDGRALDWPPPPDARRRRADRRSNPPVFHCPPLAAFSAPCPPNP